MTEQSLVRIKTYTLPAYANAQWPNVHVQKRNGFWYLKIQCGLKITEMLIPSSEFGIHWVCAGETTSEMQQELECYWESLGLIPGVLSV